MHGKQAKRCSSQWTFFRLLTALAHRINCWTGCSFFRWLFCARVMRTFSPKLGSMSRRCAHRSRPMPPHYISNVAELCNFVSSAYTPDKTRGQQNKSKLQLVFGAHTLFAFAELEEEFVPSRSIWPDGIMIRDQRRNKWLCVHSMR